MLYFWEKSSKIAEALGTSPLNHSSLGLRRRPHACYSFILLQGLLKLTVLALKRFLVVEKEQHAPIVHFKF